MAVYFTFRFFVVVGEEALPPSLVLIFTKKTGSLIGRQTGASQNCPLPLKSLARPPYVCHLRCPSTEVPQSHSMTKIRENIYIYIWKILTFSLCCYQNESILLVYLPYLWTSFSKEFLLCHSRPIQF